MARESGAVMNQLNKRIEHLHIPNQMRKLPISDRGYPVPKFVPWIDGKPEFRGYSGKHRNDCLRLGVCWLCGKPLGPFMTFVIGPMCAVNRISSEPPNHHVCAKYAARACPFLTQPRMRRNEEDMPEHDDAPGIMLRRNPGVAMLWTCKKYTIVRCPDGYLFQVGDPERIEFFAEGRTATREEILHSMETGLPALLEAAELDGPEAVAEAQTQYQQALELVPA
jgi:hypothetical protein